MSALASVQDNKEGTMNKNFFWNLIVMWLIVQEEKQQLRAQYIWQLQSLKNSFGKIAR